MERSLRQFSGLFAVLGVIGVVGLTLVGFDQLGQLGGQPIPFFIGAFVVLIQCAWLYTLSGSLAEILARTSLPKPPTA